MFTSSRVPSYFIISKSHYIDPFGAVYNARGSCTNKFVFYCFAQEMNDLEALTQHKRTVTRPSPTCSKVFSYLSFLNSELHFLPSAETWTPSHTSPHPATWTRTKWTWGVRIWGPFFPETVSCVKMATFPFQSAFTHRLDTKNERIKKIWSGAQGAVRANCKSSNSPDVGQT